MSTKLPYELNTLQARICYLETVVSQQVQLEAALRQSESTYHQVGCQFRWQHWNSERPHKAPEATESRIIDIALAILHTVENVNDDGSERI